MIAKKIDYHGNILGFTDPEDQHFFRMYVAYLSQLKFDDLAHWSNEDYNFYNSRSFSIEKE
jgi:hypothetical protein